MTTLPKLSDNDFQRLGSFIHERLGIKMPGQKKGMVESRLRKRVTQLGMGSYSEYTAYFFSKRGFHQELPHLIDAITTNKTDFFREPRHFDYLTAHALPELLALKKGGRQKINAWSSACSRGDEPYTLAMVLADYLKDRSGFDFSILATDISEKVLNIAQKAVYDHDAIEPVPQDFRKKYLLRSVDRSKKRVRIVPGLRARVTFKQLNLTTGFTFQSKFDIVFCRNVIIYFDKPTTNRLISRICSQMNNKGFLFMGHSEILEQRLFPLQAVTSNIYQKNG